MKIDIDNVPLDIVIPCTHHPTLPSSSSSSKKVLEVRLILDIYQDLVYYHTNGKRLVSKRNSQSDHLIFNPFCHDCNDDVFTAACYNNNNNMTFEEVKQKLEHLKNKVRDEGIVMYSSYDEDSEKFKIYECKVVCFDLDERVCDEEEFRAWVCDGNNRGFKEEGVPIIQGLERVDNNVDDDCGICLQNLKTLDIEDQDQDLDGGGGGGGGGACGCACVDVIPKPCLAMLPCKHVFHEPCVIRWLLKDHTCPLCRYKLPCPHVFMSD